MKKIFFVLFLLQVVACTRIINMQTIDYKDIYSIDLYSFMKPVTGLNHDASLQYGCLENNISILVVNDKKDEVHQIVSSYKEYRQTIEQDTIMELDTILDYNLEGYKKMVLFNTNKNCTNFKLISQKDTIINNLKAIDLEYQASFDKDNSYIKHLILEGKNYYFQVYLSTNQKNIKVNKQYMDNMAYTIKEK